MKKHASTKKPATPHRCRPVSLLLMALYLTGCATWQTATVSPQQLIVEERPARIVVVETDGTRTELSEPGVVANAVTGLVTRFLPVRRTLVVPLAEIAAVEFRQVNTRKTVGAIVLSSAAVVGLIAFVEVFLRCGDRCE